MTVMSERSTREIEIREDPDELHRVNKQSFIDEQEWHLYKVPVSCMASPAASEGKDKGAPRADCMTQKSKCQILDNPRRRMINMAEPSSKSIFLVNSKSHGNHIPILAMLICLLNSKFS